MKEEKKETKKKLEKSKPKYTLEELLEGVNEENLHSETDFGKPVGKEIVEYKIKEIDTRLFRI